MNMKLQTSHYKYAVVAVVITIGALFLWWHGTKPQADQRISVVLGPLPKPSFSTRNQDDTKRLRIEVLDSLGYMKNQSIEERIAVTKALPHDLADADLEALLRFLVEARDPSVSEGDHAYFFHELCNKLHHFPQIRSTYAAALYQVAGDVKQDGVTQDYALQHLRRIWEKSSADQGLRGSIQASFWQIVTADQTTAASAMLSLHNLGVVTGPSTDYTDAPVMTKDFEPIIQNVLSNTATAANISQRMTAARIAGDRKMMECSEQLLAMVENQKEHMLVRVSAINSLGKLGRKTELANLASRLDHDPRLTTALTHATR